MKKKLIPILCIALALAIGLTVFLTRDTSDPLDTEELFRENVAKVAYENTIEEAIPQTELYDIINDHFASKLPKGKTEKKAIILGFDGCRADILAEMKNEESGISLLLDEGASFNLLYCGGVNYPEVNTQKTSTAPGWCSILTGTWADVHGITANDIVKEVEPKTLLTSLVENEVIDSSSFITKWPGHFDRKKATYLAEKAYCEEKGLNVAFNKLDNDEASYNYTLEEVKKSDCADFIFVIYEPTDSAGHNKDFSFNNPSYKEAFLKEDKYAFDTINAIKDRDTFDKEDWLIIITSDHGGIDDGHGGASIQERMTFAVVL